MSDFAKQAQEAAEQYLAAIQKIQDASLDAISRVTSAIPDAAKDAAKNVPSLPTPEGLPTVEEVSSIYFDFTEKLVANQKAYTEKFLTAVKPQV
ncbi:hypothetical protein [Nakamurella sp.]|uniref:hypothetical protein n=1 Tax=Nakamurella sp. TaxID=1869182 RepID=UPI003B3A6328